MSLPCNHPLRVLIFKLLYLKHNLFHKKFGISGGGHCLKCNLVIIPLREAMELLYERFKDRRA